MAKKLTTEEFTSKARLVHGDKYDYSKVEYRASEINVCIICPEHGEFWQTPHSHLKGHGCAKCKGVYMDTAYFIKKSKEIHGYRYDYSKTIYVNSHTPLEIICKRHGSFFILPSCHLLGGGCIKCSRIDNRKKILNIAIDDVDKYMNKDKSHILWTHLFLRCYSPTSLAKADTYKDVTVCSEWHKFSNFLQWFNDHYVEGWQIDKDILVKGNKVYSPDTCCFVPQEINTCFTYRKRNKGKYPVGVSYIKAKKKFVVSVAYNGKNKTIGAYNTVEEAFNAYKTAKEQRIKELADKYKDKLEPRVYEALCNYKVEITD